MASTIQYLLLLSSETDCWWWFRRIYCFFWYYKVVLNLSAVAVSCLKKYVGFYYYMIVRCIDAGCYKVVSFGRVVSIQSKAKILESNRVLILQKNRVD